MPTKVNPNLANSTLGFESDVDFAGAADDPARVQLLIDLISIESADGDTNRYQLQGMMPHTRDNLYALLVLLKASVT